MGDAVERAVLAQFAALPKTGKPQPHEHTVLAGIALSLPPGTWWDDPTARIGRSGGRPKQEQQQQGLIRGDQQTGKGHQERDQQLQHHRQHQTQPQLAVLALATGTKCLGASRRLPGGGAVNDSHAEVLCRRALLRWLYGEMLAAVERYRSESADPATESADPPVTGSADAAPGAAAHSRAPSAAACVLRLVSLVDHSSHSAAGSGAESPDEFAGWRFQWLPGAELHMYVSQPPCGDASILGLELGGNQDSREAHNAVRCGTTSDAAVPARDGESAARAAVAAGSFGRTGAKPLKRARSGGDVAADCGQQQADGHEQQQAGNHEKPQQADSCRQQQAGSHEQQQADGLEQQQQAGSHEQQRPIERQPEQLDDMQLDTAPQDHAHAHQQQGQAGHIRGHAQPPAFPLPQQHEVESYAEAQARGFVRRKPGRGDATLSVSCSDKLARWALLGLQGALLGGLLTSPLPLTSITVGLPPLDPAASTVATAGTDTVQAAATAALQRAIVDRTGELAAERLPAGRKLVPPTLHAVPWQLSGGQGLASAPPAAHAGCSGGEHSLVPVRRVAACSGPSVEVGGTPADGTADGTADGIADGTADGTGMHRWHAALGLAPSAQRAVAAGSSVVWTAPPFTSFKWKQHALQTAAPGEASTTAAAAAAGAAAPPACAVPVLCGGVSEAVIGATGLRAGSARPKQGHPAPLSSQARVCKAALFAQWQAVVAAMDRLGDVVPSAASDPGLHGQWAEQAQQAQPGLQQQPPLLCENAAPGLAGVPRPPGQQEQQQPDQQPSHDHLCQQRTAPRALSYRQAKRASDPQYAAAWQRLLQPPSVLQGWIPKPAQLEEFTLPA